MLLQNQSNELTPREIQEYQHEKEFFEMQSTHQVKIKQLEIEEQKLEAKWASWFRIPLYILSIPVRLLALIPLCIYAIKNEKVPDELWTLLR